MRISKLYAGNADTFSVKSKAGYHCGIVYKLDDRWHVELKEKYVHAESTRDLAFAWARGAMAVIEG